MDADGMVTLLQLLTVGLFFFALYKMRKLLLHGVNRLRALLAFKFWKAALVAFFLMFFFTPPAKAALGGSVLDDFLFNVGYKLLGTVSGTVADIFEGVYNAVMNVFGDLICMLVETFGAFVIDAIDAIPDDLVHSAAQITGYLEVANHWIPLSEAGVMFGAFIAFLAIQLPFKLIMKLFIPTVG